MFADKLIFTFEGTVILVTYALPVAQQSVLLAGSCQQDQNQVQDWIQETGLEGGTGSATVWHWADPSVLLPYQSGKQQGRHDVLDE